MRETAEEPDPYPRAVPVDSAGAASPVLFDGAISLGAARLVGILALLWLIGMALRLTILAAAPVLPLIHRDLNLSETEIGTLGSLPALLFAFAAVPGAMLIARFGVRSTLVMGLLLTALGSALRGAAPGIVLLDAATIVMAGGIAIMQPALPPLVRDWMPGRVGFATAVYTNGLLVSEILAVGLAIPVVLPLAGGSWRLSLVYWAVPILATAALVVGFAPRTPRRTAAMAAAARRWWPDWRDPLVWRLGFMLGSVNTIYWGLNTFLPDYLHALGRPDLVGPALAGLNGGQLPSSLLMIAFAGRLVRRHAAYLVTGAVVMASLIAILFAQGAAIVWWASLLGFAEAATLILLLALPPLLGEQQDVPRMSAAMFTISYPCAVVLQILGGFAWDMTGIPALAFAPAGLGAAVIMLLSPGLDLDRRRAQS
jgi:MFS transporter, CP family, cyanate transporter